MSDFRYLMVSGAPTPVAPFSHAVEVDGWVFLTGQMPTDPSWPVHCGCAARKSSAARASASYPASGLFTLHALPRSALAES